jgi:serine protease Do
VWRDGSERTIRVTLGESEPVTVSALEPEATDAATAEMGLVLRPLDGESRSRLGLPEEVRGVLVASVDANSPAAQKGVRSGDVLLEVNGEAVTSTDEAVIEAAKSESGRAMLLLRCGDGQRFVSVALA